MKKFVFPLQKVLEYKSHMEEYEKNVLRQMRFQRLMLLKESDAIKARQVQCRKRYEDGCLLGITVREITILYLEITQLQEELLDMLSRISLMEEKIEIQVEKVLELSRDKTSMEKLRQKYTEAYRKEESKAAETLIEDFVGNQSSMKNALAS